MTRGFAPLAVVTSLMLCVGCLPYKQPTSRFANARTPTTDPATFALREQSASQGLYVLIPRNRQQIAWYDLPHWLTWTFFGNERDGIFGEDAQPPFTRSPGMESFLAWELRNPATNFCFYVIGSGDWKTHHAYTVVKFDATGATAFGTDRNPSVFGQGDKSFLIAFNDYKPFVSFRFPISKYHMTDFYFGWRPEGHFGVKFRPWKSIDAGT